jgi:hypothetical protein
MRDRLATQECYNGEGSEAQRPRAEETQADQAKGFSPGHGPLWHPAEADRRGERSKQVDAAGASSSCRMWDDERRSGSGERQ